MKKTVMSYRLLCQTAILTICCLFVGVGQLKAQDYYYIQMNNQYLTIFQNQLGSYGNYTEFPDWDPSRCYEWQFIMNEDNSFLLKSRTGKYIAFNNGWTLVDIESDATALVCNNDLYYDKNSNTGLSAWSCSGVVTRYNTNDATTVVPNPGMPTGGSGGSGGGGGESSGEGDKTIQHRVHQLVKDAQEYKADGGKIPQGFLDGSKELVDNGNGKKMQYTSVYEFTVYVRPGERTTLYFPMIQYGSMILHRDYQRFYNYKTDDLTDLQWQWFDFGGAASRFTTYQNGFVTGISLKDNNDADNNYVNNSFTVSLPAEALSGDGVDIACDMSNYTDMEYDADGDIAYEPSLSQRVIWHIRSAQQMADRLSTETWLEEKTIHFPATSVNFEPDCIGLESELSNYWFNNAGTLANLGENAQYVQIEIEGENRPGISLLNGQKDGRSGIKVNGGLAGLFVNSDLGLPGSRFVAFTYPQVNGPSDIPQGKVKATGENNAAVICVYAQATNGTRYKVARFTLIFDENSSTLPWSDVLRVNNLLDSQVKRSPNELARRTGRGPIAQITFDYPSDMENSVRGTQNSSVPADWSPNPLQQRERTFTSSKLALDFAFANYMHSTKWMEGGQVQPATHYGNTGYFYDCKWGEYVLTTETGFWNALGPFLGVNNYQLRHSIPTDEQWQPESGLLPGFLYVDASERAGSVASVPFKGTFCPGNKLMCSGWITTGTAYGWNNGAAPSSVILSVVGRDYDQEGNIVKEKVLHRFCPGQISLEMRHANGSYETASNVQWNMDGGWISTNADWKSPEESGPWQQFYYEFSIGEQYDSYLLNIDNNCVSTSGGDFMLDDIMIFASVPEVEMEESVPLCVRQDGEYDVEMLKQLVNFDVQLEVMGNTEATSAATASTRYMSFAFLEKDVFLTTFRQEANLGSLSLEDIEKNIESGSYDDETYDTAYASAFWASLVGDKEQQDRIWKSSDLTNAPENCGLLQFEWSTYFQGLDEYSFLDAIDKTNRKPIYRYVRDENGVQVRYILFNANIPNIVWKVSTEYYVIPYNEKVPYDKNSETLKDWRKTIPASFDLRTPCSKKKTFKLRPSLEILAVDKLEGDDELEACENQIPTIVTDLDGYTEDGEEVAMENLNFDWWVGKRPNGTDEGIKATLENYAKYKNEGETTTLREALLSFRQYYPDNETLEGVEPREATGDYTASLTQDMIDFLRQLVDEGQLILHTKLLNTRVFKWSDDDPYFYFVAAPIIDDTFKETLNPEGKPVVYYCDEPQQLRVMVKNVAPTLESGFVDGMNGIKEYDYGNDGTALSLRLARMGQFQKVQRADIPQVDGLTENDLKALKCMVVPLREAHAAVTDGIGVHNHIQFTSVDNYIHLADTDDQDLYDKLLSDLHNNEGTLELPKVGRIVSLLAVDTDKDDVTEADKVNYMRFFFLDNFEVRDGYNYTLKIPFRDKTPDGTGNACDGDMLIKLKIVPDYEVWTGGAGNTDWNNDDNWRRADANDLLLRGEGYAPNTEQKYLTNEENENSHGFAPLYCTHIMIKTDEGTDRPELYDMYGNGRTQEDGTVVAGIAELDNTPFPNLNPQTATGILKYDFQACPYQADKHGFGYENDLVAEMYDINLCEDIVFQHHTELLNPYLLTYNKAWVEYQMAKNQWHLVGSPLQDMISAEWYAPKERARQETTYYEPVHFDDHIVNGGYYEENDQANRYDILYDRFAPAVYQRAWDKARAVIYERGAEWSAEDGQQTGDAGESNMGEWVINPDSVGYHWESHNADEYLERLVYKPLGDSKANVAIRGTWSGVYNDHTVPYSGGGFSVLPINSFKAPHNEDSERTIFRFPKEDQYYDIWDWNKSYQLERRVRVYIQDERENDEWKASLPDALQDSVTTTNTLQLAHRGRLRSDIFAVKGTGTEGLENGKILDKDLNGERVYEMTLKNEGNGSVGFFLACNPFICGLDMKKFFEVNSDIVAPYYLVLEDDEMESDDELTEKYNNNKWSWTEVGISGAQGDPDFEGTQIVAPRYGFFLRAKDGGNQNQVTVKFTPDMMVRTPRTETEEPNPARPYFTIRAQRNGNSSEARVIVSPDASNTFRAEEDMETFLVSDITSDIPVVYTLTGRLATSINRLHDFTVLPIGIESNSEAPAILTFDGVEYLSSSPVQLYDAYLQTLTPIFNQTRISVPGATAGRYFLVTGISPIDNQEERAVNVFAADGTIHVVSTADDIVGVDAYNAAGQTVYSQQLPQVNNHTFRLPPSLYIVKARTGDGTFTRKLVLK